MGKLPVPEKWDYETDVLIVGGGTAGLPAGIAITEAGSKATVLELTTLCGGSGNLIFGLLSVGGTSAQKKLGIDDSPEFLYKDGVEIACGSPELWRVYADNAVDTFEWLMKIGVTMEMDNLIDSPGHRKKRGHIFDGPSSMRTIEKEARNKGVEILFGHRATRLIIDPQTERVIGLKVSVKDKTKNFRAKKAVILATGGFGRNKEMVREYGARYLVCPPSCAPGHLGDGLKMAMELGAATKDIGDAVVPSFPGDAETLGDSPLIFIFQGALAVNVHGKRFYDEACPHGYYGHFTEVGMDQPGGDFWVIYDEKIRTGPDIQPWLKKHYIEVKADTLEELAKKLGIDPKGFRETIDKYNSDLDSEGYDTVFGKKTMTFEWGSPVLISTPPFYGIKCVTTTSSFKGGLKVNTRSQVLNQYNEVIPGLYAAGEVTGGLFTRKTYMGGTMWPSSMTFGRLAGRNAVLESP